MKLLPVDDDTRSVAAEALARGAMVVLPTDTVYGVAVAAATPGAAARLAEAKGRSADQPIAVLVADLDQVAELAVVDERAQALAQEFWPGPLTMIVERLPAIDLDLGEPSTTVGVRCPAFPFLVDLARAIGPLAVTSANRHGEATPRGAVEAAASIDADVALVIDGGVLDGVPSTVVDLVGPSLGFLRIGAIDEEQIDTCLSRGRNCA